MVRYWKKSEAVQAKVMKQDGVTVMQMDGEKYVFPGFPRGHILFGRFSKLKHEIKNQIFNESWAKLENKATPDEVVKHIRKVLPSIYEVFDEMKYDLVPPSAMVKPVREIHRAWTKTGLNPKLRDLLTFIIQEDDAYRFRFQWIVSWFPFFTKNPIKMLEKSLKWLEIAEIIGDMKERVRLFRRIILTILENDDLKQKVESLFKEIDWKKVKMSKADKYFFRGKYFKVDLDKFEY